MAGNSAIFKKANQLMKEGYPRKQAFAIAYSELGEPKKNPLQAFKVYLNGKHIDTVFQSGNDSVADVKRSLVNHDGYDPEIVVKKERKKPEVKKNPLPRNSRGKVTSLHRPSQITKKAPKKRLLKRRKVNIDRAPRGVFPNPRGRGDIDEIYGREIFLYGQNDGDLYRHQVKGLKNFLVFESAFSDTTGFKLIGVFNNEKIAIEFAHALNRKYEAENKTRWIKVESD